MAKTSKNPRSIMIVTGEASGDGHAAKVVRAIRSSEPEIEFFGATGRALHEEGVETIVNADDFAIVGILEIAKVLPMFWDAFRKLRDAAAERKPDAVLLVDFPEFNLKLAKSLKKQGLKVIYYISPQLWAWRRYRERTIRKNVDLLLTILPFEKTWYRSRSIEHVEYVGSPLVNEVASTVSKDEFCRKVGLDASSPIIALLPGSRGTEISRIFPVMLETAALMSKNNSSLQFVAAISANRSVGEVRRLQNGVVGRVTYVHGQTYDALAAADAAAVCSGTATLETAIIGTPLVIVYKGSSLNYRILRPLISTEHFGLINLIAEERIAAELIQDEFKPESLAAELSRLLQPAENRVMREKLRDAVAKLGTGGASERAAEAILKELA